MNYRMIGPLCVVLVVATYNVDNQLAPPKLNRLNRSNAMTMTTATEYYGPGNTGYEQESCAIAKMTARCALYK